MLAVHLYAGDNEEKYPMNVHGGEAQSGNRLEDGHAEAGASERQRRGQTVRSGPDDDRVRACSAASAAHARAPRTTIETPSASTSTAAPAMRPSSSARASGSSTYVRIARFSGRAP